MKRLKDYAVEQWEAHGLQCMIVRARGKFMNGYVQLPESHTALGKDYDDIDIDVHGGLTYGPDEDGWLGFDTGHTGDEWSEEELEGTTGEWDSLGLPSFHIPSSYGVRWSRAKLHAEVESLAEQLAVM